MSKKNHSKNHSKKRRNSFYNKDLAVRRTRAKRSRLHNLVSQDIDFNGVSYSSPRQRRLSRNRKRVRDPINLTLPVASPANRAMMFKWLSSFSDNELSRAKVCARRQIRKAVIHALGHAGSGNRKPTFNERSKIKC